MKTFLRSIGLIVLSLVLFPVKGYLVPNQTMTITPTATSGTTITASDENTRNNNISTPYNAHSHADIASTTANVYTIGDNVSGNKDYCEDSATDRCIRWNETAGLWTIQQNGTSYQQIVVSTGTVGLSNGTLLVGNGIGAIRNLGSMTNGQLAIGSTGSDPVIAVLTAGGGITITNGAGAITVASAQQRSVGSFTRDTTSASGTQAITGPGFQPQALSLGCTVNGTRKASWNGYTDGTNNFTVFDNFGTVDTYSTQTSFLVYDDDGTGNSYTATLSTFDTSGFTLSWTKTGSPTGTLTCGYLAVR